MTDKQTPIEKQSITVTEGTEAPFLPYAGDDEKIHVRVFIHAETPDGRTVPDHPR
jgi:hypothetical protein